MVADRIDVNVVTDGTPADVARLAALADEHALTLWLTPSESRLAPNLGAQQALSELAAFDRLVPIEVLAPPTGSPAALGRALQLVEGGGPRVARLCPTGHHYPLVDWALSPLPELCERHALALMLDFAPAPIPWLELVAFARRYPSVPMIALDCDLRWEPAAPAALDAALNLLLHVASDADSTPLLELLAIFGPGRFVGGSATGADPDSAGVALLDPLVAASLSATAASLADGEYASRYF